MGRSPRCSKDGLNKGAWTANEDKLLVDYIKAHGEGRWSRVSRETGLKRCGKSCRLRWMNYLRPDIKRGNISSDEEELIIRLHKLLGNRWSLIAGRLPGRTDNEIKNYWNTNLAKKADEEKSLNLKESPATTPQPMVQSQLPQVPEFPNGGASLRPNIDVALGPQPIDDNDNNNNNDNYVMKQMVYDSDFSDGSLSFNSAEENSSDFMMDFNMDDLCLMLDADISVHATDVLNQEQAQQGGGHRPYDYSRSKLSEEMDKDTIQDDMVPSDFQSLVSLFEPDEKWRVDDV